MQRIASHYIIYEGQTFRNSVIELADDGRVRLFPFSGEIHSTRFIPGCVRVEVDASGCGLTAVAEELPDAVNDKG